MEPLARRTPYYWLVRLLAYIYSIHAFTYVHADTDLWGHIKFGGDIWREGSIPMADPYSYTALGHLWINHEWLSELGMFLVYDTLGSSGLLGVKLILGLTMVHILSQLYFARASNLWTYLLHFLIFTHVVAGGFATRPQIATFFFSTILVWIFYTYFDGKERIIYWVPPLVLVWVNCHGGVVAGVGLLGMVTLVESFRCYKNGQPLPRPLWIATILSCLALLANPYGIDLLIFLASTITRSRAVTEWESIHLFDLNHMYFKIGVLLFFITLFNKQPKRYWELAIIVFGIVYGFKHQRHAVLTAILMTPYLPLQINYFLKNHSLASRPLSGLVRNAGMIALTLAIASQMYIHSRKLSVSQFQIVVDPLVYPVYPVRFMKDNNINGNILLPMAWGEYAIWKCPDSRVSFDGRYWTSYPEEVVIQNLVFHMGWEGWQYMLDLYPHDVILTNKINKELEKHPGWVKIYEDMTSRVFLKKTEPPSNALKKFYEGKLFYNQTPPSQDFP